MFTLTIYTVKEAIIALEDDDDKLAKNVVKKEEQIDSWSALLT